MQGDYMQGIDLFSGAGGLSLGALWAGIDIKYAIESDQDAATTYKKNHQTCKMLNTDIRNVYSKDLRINRPFILFGGPPCQGYSLSNQKTRTIDNPKNLLYKEFIRFVKELTPEWVLFENVQGIVTFNKGQVISDIENDFKKLGYKVQKKIMNACEYGVPQVRNRFILVANRVDVDFCFPKPIPGTVTVADAIMDLPTLSNGELKEKVKYGNHTGVYIQKIRNGAEFATQNYVSKNKEYVLERYKYIKQGENWKSIPAKLMQNYANLNNCHSGIYYRLKENEPSIIISNYRKNMLIHPTQDRGLSVREAARLQSFPDTFEFYGTLNKIQQQIGNAVPPLLAQAVFQRIMQYG